MNSFTLALTSALVDFIWQGALIAGMLLSALHVLGRRSAQVRYTLNVLALIALIVSPIVTTASRYRSPKPEWRVGFTVPDFSIAPGTDDQRIATVDLRRDVTPALSAVEPWVLPLWSFGVFLLSLRLVAGGIEVRALRRTSQHADETLCERLAHIAARMGIRRSLRLATSTRTGGPAVIGWLKPLVLLPPATVLGLSTAQLDAVLAHELAHIRRHDYVVNIIQMVAETLLFYHPAVWWVSTRLRIERELCCDDDAVRVCGDRTAYARALVTMARLQSPSMAVGATGGSLRDRVRRLLGVGGHDTHPSAACGLMALAMAITAIALVDLSAQIEHPRFEVASIKPAAEGRGFSGTLFLPGGVVRNSRVPLFMLIAAAYDAPWAHIEGVSSQMNERFAIEAKADARALPPKGSTLEQTFRAHVPVLRDMLKTLLAERFKLTLHVERRDSPIYALVIGPKGHRLAPAARDCFPTTVEEMTSVGPCGRQGGGPAGGLRLRNSDLSQLADALSNFVDRTIVDRTGVSSRFDIDVPPWSTGAPPRPDADEPQPDPTGPSIFTVIQQLGLRLEPARGPIDYYVVDHVERPSEN